MRRTAAHSALALLFISGCARGDGEREASWLATLLDAGHRFAAGHQISLPSDDSAETQLEAVTKTARDALAAGASPHQAVTRAIFDVHGYQREVDDVRPEHMFLASTLHQGRGSCLGLAQLVAVVGERLSLPLRPVVAPGHVFITDTAASDGQEYWEALRRGEIMPASWYHERYRVPAGASAYMRPLEIDELVGVLAYNLGNEDRKLRRLGRAALRYAEATRRFPGFPEAHASAGLVHHLLGDLDAAERSYERARALNPELPGLSENLGVLARERLWRWANAASETDRR